MTTLARGIITALVVWVLLLVCAAGIADAHPELQWLNRVEVARSPGESTEDRRARLVEVEHAIIDAAGNDVELVAAMVVVGTLESHWSKAIGEGRCGRHQCDRDPKTGRPRALGYFQLWRPACPELHARGGAPDVAVAADCAARLLRFGRHRCGHWRGAFATYAGLLDCDHPIGKRRAAKMARLLGRGGDA